MVSVICRDGKFLVKGSFFMGNVGTFENSEYGEGNIAIGKGPKELMNDLEKAYIWMKPIRQLLESGPKDEESVAKMYEDYINGLEQTVRKNVKQVNDYFWYQLVNDLVDREIYFWEIEEAILPGFRGKCTEEECLDAYGNEELQDVRSKLYEEFEGTPNDGSLEKTDVEALIKKVFPMFNLDGLAAAIEPEYLCIEGGMLQLQFSDGWDNSFFCAAAVEFDDHLTPMDWNNF